MPTITIAPVRKNLRANVPQAKAFEIFTNGIDRWWPRTHHLGSSPMTRAVIEPFTGGRWYHSCEDGSESEVGRVLIRQPPERLLLAWHINGNWHHDPEVVTEVDIHFIAVKRYDHTRRTRTPTYRKARRQGGDIPQSSRWRLGCHTGMLCQDGRE